MFGMDELLDAMHRFGRVQVEIPSPMSEILRDKPLNSRPFATRADAPAGHLEFARALRDEPGCSGYDLLWLDSDTTQWTVALNGYEDARRNARLDATIAVLRGRLNVPDTVTITYMAWQ